MLVALLLYFLEVDARSRYTNGLCSASPVIGIGPIGPPGCPGCPVWSVGRAGCVLCVGHALVYNNGRRAEPCRHDAGETGRAGHGPPAPGAPSADRKFGPPRQQHIPVPRGALNARQGKAKHGAAVGARAGIARLAAY